MKKKSLIFFLLILFFSFNYLHPENKKEIETVYCFASDKKMQVGEELTYLVKYSIFKLGEIKFKVISKKEFRGETVYSTIAYIDSYGDVPFVDLHQIYQSYINKDYYSDFFRGIIKTDKYDTFTEYYFKYDSSKVRVIKGKIEPKEVWTDSVGTIKKEYEDGLSIFYYARMNSGQNMIDTISTFVNEKKEKTIINFTDEVSGVSIDAVDYEISCVKLEGEAQFVSIFGLTGDFEGWFSNDDASIPIAAKLHVLIGNITVELIDWKREGWTPPRYND